MVPPPHCTAECSFLTQFYQLERILTELQFVRQYVLVTMDWQCGASRLGVCAFGGRNCDLYRCEEITRYLHKMRLQKYSQLLGAEAGPSGRAVEGVGPRQLAWWDCRFESHRVHGCLSVVSVVCCKVEVSAKDWSLVQRSPTDCGASLCVIKKPRKRGG